MMKYINYRDEQIKQKGSPDIITIIQKQPQTIEKYLNWCRLIKILPYGGKNGNPLKQNKGIGKILSGYRDHILEGGAKDSPHFYCIAIDVFIPFWNSKKILIQNVYDYTKKAFEAGFLRVGLYPSKNMCHFDLANSEWCSKRNAFSHCWVQKKNLEYLGFQQLFLAWNFILENQNLF
ncbi:MAG: hypothetical protein NC833_03305 [Candidatus Omnitrophica bacterium]|nr:hypothetical protein [Candidatus Omnitrophota bacterium]